uniref:bromo adjacent homology domain-containing 1 protein n=1 Tax=Myxine glutinosa TaxID=7769 RepID=UPI003590035A
MASPKPGNAICSRVVPTSSGAGRNWACETGAAQAASPLNERHALACFSHQPLAATTLAMGGALPPAALGGRAGDAPSPPRTRDQERWHTAANENHPDSLPLYAAPRKRRIASLNAEALMSAMLVREPGVPKRPKHADGHSGQACDFPGKVLRQSTVLSRRRLPSDIEPAVPSFRSATSKAQGCTITPRRSWRPTLLRHNCDNDNNIDDGRRKDKRKGMVPGSNGLAAAATAAARSDQNIPDPSCSPRVCLVKLPPCQDLAPGSRTTCNGKHLSWDRPGRMNTGSCRKHFFPSVPSASRLRPTNGWLPVGPPYEKEVFVAGETNAVRRRCYRAVSRCDELIGERDCVLLRSGPRRKCMPYVAKVSALWEEPHTGELTMSLFWYYRPEHTQAGRNAAQHGENEIFASRHQDANSVACIEDKCFVLTYLEYCRFRAEAMRRRTKAIAGCGARNLVPPLLAYSRPAHRHLHYGVSSSLVFVCRRVYDFRLGRILKNPV